MVTRIKELAEQAGYKPLPGLDFANSIQEIYTQKFAELIVRECVRCVTQPTIQAEFPHDIVIREIQNVLANDMKSYFGFEE